MRPLTEEKVVGILCWHFGSDSLSLNSFTEDRQLSGLLGLCVCVWECVVGVVYLKFMELIFFRKKRKEFQ